MPDTEEKGDNIRGTSNNPDIYDEPSDKMWSIYVSEAEKFDKALVESWKGDMEGLLIFAGLFSASVTAFIIESYKKLSPDSGDAMVVLLAQISSQLVAISNGTNLSITSPPPAKTSFRPTSSAVTVNILWFLSLSLGLLCALGATMVQQWARNYAQLIERRPAPNKRARIRAYLYEGIETFRVKAVVDVIPTLLHLSLFLFFTGLVVFLLPIDLRVALPMIIVLIIGVILYTTITFLPMVYKNCPYRTPLTPTLWNIMQGLSLLRYRTASGNVIRIRGKMVEGQEQLATEAIPERNERDTAALRWTLKSLADDNGLERFIDAIPAFLRSSGGTPFEVLENLMLEGLCNRTRRLFVGCHERAGLDGTLRRRRAILCMSTLRAMVTNSMKSSLGWLPSAWGDTLEALRKDNDSTVAVLAICTTATAAFHLLSFIAQDIPSKSGEHAADEQFLEKMFSLIPIDELAASMVMGGGISTQLSAELIGDTLHILRNQDVLDATNRYLINCARYRTEIAKYRLQVIFDFFNFNSHSLGHSLDWISADVIHEAKKAEKYLRNVGENSDGPPTQHAVWAMLRMLQSMKMKKTRAEFLNSGGLEIMNSFLSELLQRGHGIEENSGVILQTLQQLVRSNLSLDDADLDTQANFIHLVNDAIISPTVTFQIIDVLLQLFGQLSNPKSAELAITVLEGNRRLHGHKPSDEILYTLKTKLLKPKEGLTIVIPSRQALGAPYSVDSSEGCTSRVRPGLHLGGE